MRTRDLLTVGAVLAVLGATVDASADESPNLREAIRFLNVIGGRSLKMHFHAIDDGRTVTGVRTSINLADRERGLTYEHDIGSSVPGNPDSPAVKVEVAPGPPELPTRGETAPGNPDHGASVNANYFGGVGNPDLRNFSLGMHASSSSSPWLKVETVPGNPDQPGDVTLHFAVGNPDLFPSGRVHVDLGPGNSFDLVKTTSATGVVTMVQVPTR